MHAWPHNDACPSLLVMSRGSLALFLPLVRQVFVAMKWLYGSSHVPVYKARWCAPQIIQIPCWLKLTSWNSHSPGNAGLSGPTMKVFFHVLTNLLTVILFVFLGFCRYCKSCGEQMIIVLHSSFYYHQNSSFITILDDFYALHIYSAVCSLHVSVLYASDNMSLLWTKYQETTSIMGGSSDVYI